MNDMNVLYVDYLWEGAWFQAGPFDSAEAADDHRRNIGRVNCKNAVVVRGRKPHVPLMAHPLYG